MLLVADSHAYRYLCILVCSFIFFVNGMTEEECNIIGAPDSNTEVRTCSFIENEELSNDVNSCVPSQDWVKGTLNNSDFDSFITECSHDLSTECVAFDHGEGVGSCTRDLSAGQCMASPYLLIYSLLEGMVNTFPLLKENALDFPSVCAAKANNISCIAVEGCKWAPFDYQFDNGDIYLKDRISNLSTSVEEIQTLNFDSTDSTFAGQESIIEFSSYEVNQSVLSILILRHDTQINENSTLFQLSFLEATSSKLFDFNTNVTEVEITVIDLLDQVNESGTVNVIKENFNEKSVLFEFHCSSPEIAQNILVTQQLGKVIVVRHALNTQIIELQNLSENFSFDLVYIPTIDLSLSKSLTITETSRSVDLLGNNFFDEMLFAKIELDELDNSLTYTIKFLSAQEDVGEGTVEEYQNEFLLQVENEVNVKVVNIYYENKNKLINLNSLVSLKICSFSNKVSGLARLEEGSNRIAFFGYSPENLKMPNKDDFILVSGVSYIVKDTMLSTFNDTIDMDTLRQLYQVELSNSIESNLGMNSNLIEAFTCSYDSTEIVSFKDDEFTFQEAITNLYQSNSLDNTVSVTVSDLDSLEEKNTTRSLKVNISSVNNIRKLVVEVLNCPLERMDYCEPKPNSRGVRVNVIHISNIVPFYRLLFGGYDTSDVVTHQRFSDRTGSFENSEAQCSVNAEFQESCQSLHSFRDLANSHYVCVSKSFIETTLDSIMDVVGSLCNAKNVNIVRLSNNFTSPNSSIFSLEYGAISPHSFSNPFELAFKETANVPQMIIIVDEGFEGQENQVVYSTDREGIGSILQKNVPLNYEDFIGSPQDNPCIARLQIRNERVRALGIVDATEIESLKILDEQMYTCAGRSYEVFDARQGNSADGTEAGLEAPPPELTKERCLDISFAVDPTQDSSLDRACVWRDDRNISRDNRFFWTKLAYAGVSPEVIYSPCTVPLKIAARRLLRLYRLFTPLDAEDDKFPGYDNVLGSAIKTHINNYLNQDGRCSTPHDDSQLTSVFTRSWQLIITHCLYMSSAVYALAGCRAVFVLTTANKQVWKCNFASFKRLFYCLWLVFIYMMGGILHVGIIFCIPAAVLAKFIGSVDISENILISLGHTAALMILYIDLGFFIKER